MHTSVPTHMRAAGATEEDRRDRGNYSAGSNNSC
jgi:hypothetical protein